MFVEWKNEEIEKILASLTAPLTFCDRWVSGYDLSVVYFQNSNVKLNAQKYCQFYKI